MFNHSSGMNCINGCVNPVPEIFNPSEKRYIGDNRSYILNYGY